MKRTEILRKIKEVFLQEHEGFRILYKFFAEVVELADTPALEAGARKALRVQVPSSALRNYKVN